MRKGIIYTYRDVVDGDKKEGNGAVFGSIFHSYAGMIERLYREQGPDFVVISLQRI